MSSETCQRRGEGADPDLQLRLQLSDLLVFLREFIQEHLHVLRGADEPVLETFGKETTFILEK